MHEDQRELEHTAVDLKLLYASHCDGCHSEAILMPSSGVHAVCMLACRHACQEQVVRAHSLLVLTPSSSGSASLSGGSAEAKGVPGCLGT